MSFSQHFRF